MGPWPLLFLGLLAIKGEDGGPLKKGGKKLLPSPKKKKKKKRPPSKKRVLPPKRPTNKKTRRKKRGGGKKGKVRPASIDDDDLSFPGVHWTPFQETPSDVSEVAADLNPELWGVGKGASAVYLVGNRPIGFLAIQTPEGGRGVSAWHLKAGTQLPTGFIEALDVYSPQEGEDTEEEKDERREKEIQRADELDDETKPGVKLPTLRVGSRGNDVELLQKRLGGVDIDGIFGPKTRSAVIAYQSQNGLDVDGIVGPKTWSSLFGR